MEVNQSNATTGPPATTDGGDDMLPGLITAETRILIEDVISCGFLPIIFLLGLVGNLMSLAVLLHQGTRETTNVMLVGLTLTDLLYVTLWYASQAECVIRRFAPLLAHNVGVTTESVLVMPAYLLSRVSAWFICLIASERFVAVLFPLRASSIIRRGRVVAACAWLYVSVFALGSYMLFAYDTVDVFSPELNATVLKLTFSEFVADNFVILNFYTDVFLSFVFRSVPLLVVLFCTAAVLRALKKSVAMRIRMTGKRDSSSTTRHDQEQKRITKTLLSICILFIVCTVPAVVLQIARAVYGRDGFTGVGRYRNICSVILSVVRLFDFFNSSVNFVLYIITSRKFAATWRKLFLCGRGRSRADEITDDSRILSDVTEGVSVPNDA